MDTNRERGAALRPHSAREHVFARRVGESEVVSRFAALLTIHGYAFNPRDLAREFRDHFVYPTGKGRIGKDAYGGRGYRRYGHCRR